MTRSQERVLGWVGIAVLLLAAAFMVLLVVEIANGSYLARGNPEAVTLSFAWKRAVTLIKLGMAAGTVFSAVLAIVTVAVGVVAKSYGRAVEIAALVVVSAIGLAAAFILLGEIDPEISEVPNDIRYYGGFAGDPAEVSGKIAAFAYAIIGWFGLYAASMLGLSALKEGGAIEGFIRRLKGD